VTPRGQAAVEGQINGDGIIEIVRIRSNLPYMCANRMVVLIAILFATVTAATSAQSPAFRYFRVGSATNVSPVSPRAGFALMGGGDDLDEAFRWLCDRADGGDFLVLRATGDNEYNPYLRKLCHLNSVATLIIPSRTAAGDPVVARTISAASAIFIAGGDQANYINFWMGTPVQAALNEAIRRGVPIGGTSAGLAVLGEYAYSAQGDKPDDPNLDSKTALADPFNSHVTLVQGFLDIPILKNIITDSHFAKRNRMGRLLVFLARLKKPDCKAKSESTAGVRGIGVDQESAVLVGPDGTASVVGNGNAWFIDARNADGPLCGPQALTFGPYSLTRITPGRTFNLQTWTGDGSTYRLSVTNGELQSTQPGGEIY
jgi:cyanophycinase